MKNVSSFRRAILIVALVGLSPWSSAGGQLALTPAERLAEIVKAYPCRTYSFPIDVLRREQFKGAGCSLVGFAIDQIARGRGKSIGLVPRDTSRIVYAYAIEVRAQALADPTIAKDQEAPFWSVTLQLQGRTPSVRITIDEQSGHLEIANSEPVSTARLRKPVGFNP
jgi:hypothetical protein